MNIDMQTQFSNSQALTSGAESENIVDVGPCDLGRGGNISLYVSVADGASGPLTVSIKTADTEDMAGAVTVIDIHAPADSVAKGGVVVAARLPTGCKRYLRLAYAGAAGGTVSAGLVKDA